MAHRKWKEIKQQPSLLPGPAVPGSCLVSFHFLWAILCPQAVLISNQILSNLLMKLPPWSWVAMAMQTLPVEQPVEEEAKSLALMEMLSSDSSIRLSL